MTDDIFESSDSARSGAPLRFAQYLTLPGAFSLEGGGALSDVTVCYETYGSLAKDCANAVLVCHAVSGDSHVARHTEDDEPGWWDVMIGPGKPIDTDRYFVVCSNALGGCRGTTGPNFANPASTRPYGADFPAITVGDMVDVQARLIDELGITQLLAVVGGSLGGHQALAWATRHPQRVAGCVALATSPRLTSQALAFDVVGRNAITHDPGFRGGQYYGGDGPVAGLAIARMLAHVTYLSGESMEEKFRLTRFDPRDVATAFEKKFSVGSYLAHQGSKFVDRFDANSYVTLSMAMDLFDLGDTQEKLRDALSVSECRWLIASFSSDWLYPPAEGRAMTRALLSARLPVSYAEITSACGHDAFLLEDDIDRYGRLVAGFLSQLSGHGTVRSEENEAATGSHADDAESIFHARRLDFDIVLDLVPRGASVIELGCGNGELLALLRNRGHDRVVGVEIDEIAVVESVENGHCVVQAGTDDGLSAFEDDQFDVAVLSQTVQAIDDITGILRDLVRVAKHAIVSFPNFAYRPLREMLYNQGRVPKSEGLYSYDWHDSPNRRFPTIIDFEELCESLSIRIERRVYLDTVAGEEVTENPNMDANIAVLLISR